MSDKLEVHRNALRDRATVACAVCILYRDFCLAFVHWLMCHEHLTHSKDGQDLGKPAMHYGTLENE